MNGAFLTFVASIGLEAIPLFFLQESIYDCQNKLS